MDATTMGSIVNSSANDWAARCNYWHQLGNAGKAKRKRRERRSEALVLAGHGISIAVHRGTLLIKDGNTHFPGQQINYQFFKGALDLPPRIILVDGSGAITLDALDWLTAQKIDLIRLNWDGRVASVATASGYAADPRKVAWQIATQLTPGKRLAFAIPLIDEKIKATLINLQTLLPASNFRDTAIELARVAITELVNNPPRTISKLLAIEGRVAAGYFYSWRALAINWRGTSRYPVPEDWRRFFSRSSLNSVTRIKNVNASHPVNAMLNYAYAVLETSLRIKTIAEGYDPTIGIIHESRKPEKHSFVFDRMESRRPVVDRAILGLVSGQAFTGSDFILGSNGECRLCPPLARLIASRAGDLA